MTIEKIVDYVMRTPHNTNPAILIGMLQALLKEVGHDQPTTTSVLGEGTIGDMVFGE